MERKTTTIRIVHELDDRLEALARELGFTKNALIIRACHDLADAYENKQKNQRTAQ